MKLHIPRRANIVTGALLTASLVILIGVVYFAFNIQVIKDWHLTLPSQEIHAGDTIVVASTYTKLRQVTGISTRSIECAIKPGIYLSTPLNKVLANRAANPNKKTGTGILVQIPASMKGITSLPDPCHICVALSYPVLPGRSVPYFNCTKDFELLPVVAAGAPPASSQGSPSPVAVLNRGSSSTNITSVTNTTQLNPSQPTQPVTPQPSQNIVQRVLGAVDNLIKGVL